MKNDDTRPFRIPVFVRKIPKSIYFLIAFLVVVIIVLGIYLLMQKTNKEEALKKKQQKLISEKNRVLKEINSMYYILDSKKDLLKGDILKGGFLKSYKLAKVVPRKYYKRSIDLRNRNYIRISASTFKLDKIDDIVIYPKLFKKDKHYKITFRKNNTQAVLTILDKGALKQKRVVIAVE